MLNKILWAVGTVCVSLILVAVFNTGAGKSVLGVAGAGITNLTGLSIDGTSPGTLNVNSTATIGGSLKVLATTGCIQFYATSTATSLYMVASTTGTIPPGAAAVMTANYGTCP